MLVEFENRAVKLVKTHLFGKKDLAGDSLSNHCIRVGLMAANWLTKESIMDDDSIVEVAILHDILEDSIITEADLIQLGYSSTQVASINMLTHKPSISYDEYIDNICEHGDLTTVLAKLCDNQDNQCQFRWGVTDKTTERALKLIVRYQQAEEKLEYALKKIMLG